MYWPHEHSVTAVNASKICSTTIMNIGSDCEVMITDNKYKGKIAAKGMQLHLKIVVLYTYSVRAFYYNTFRDKG